MRVRKLSKKMLKLRKLADRRRTNKIMLKEGLSNFTRVTSLEQCQRYKEHFNSIYGEYRRLHTIVAKVSNHFAQLEQRLSKAKKDSKEWKRIKDQILKDYEESKKDNQVQETRKKFQHLHNKLTHIKRLVLEYDAAKQDGQNRLRCGSRCL